VAETLAIEPRRGGRGKTWKVECLGLITADRYWSAPSGKAYRPIYLCIAQQVDVLRGFIAHFEAGRPATLRSRHGHEEPYQVETHAALRWTEPQRTGGGVSVATAWLPELCELDATRMPDRLRFLMAPGKAWLAEQLATLPIQALPEPQREAAVMGGLFAAYVGARTPWPIVPDPLFHARIWLAVQRHESWCIAPSGSPLRPGPVWSYPGTAPEGIATAVMFDAGHHEFQVLLGEETRRYFEAEGAGRLETATAFGPKETQWTAQAKDATGFGTRAKSAEATESTLTTKGEASSTAASVATAPDVFRVRPTTNSSDAEFRRPSTAKPAPSETETTKEEPFVHCRVEIEQPPAPHAVATWQPSLFD
jgi:hypothetical protein